MKQNGAVGSRSNGPDLIGTGRPELGFRRAAVHGGDASTCGVPGDRWCPGMRESYLDDQRDEARSMAWRWSLVTPPPSAIARRSCVMRQSEACCDGGDDLLHKNARDDVQGLRTSEREQKGEERGAGGVGERPEIEFLPAASCGGSSSS